MIRCRPNPIIPIIYLSAFTVIVFISFFYFLYSHKKKREVLKKLSNYLMGSISKFSFVPSFNGEYLGLKFSIVLIPAHKSSPPCLNISLVKNFFLKLRIYREDSLSQLGKKIGVIREVKINDEIFDREFLIFSNNPIHAINYLNNESIKKTVRELFNSGFNVLLIDSKKLLIKKPNYNLEQDLEPSKVIDILQKLTLLTKGL